MQYGVDVKIIEWPYNYYILTACNLSTIYVYIVIKFFYIFIVIFIETRVYNMYYVY